MRASCTGPLGPSVKKPRGLAPDDPWLESLQGSSWVDEDLDKRDRSWLDLGSANQAPLEPSVTLKASGRGTNLCRVVALDRPGLLGDISDVFNRRGLNVVKCRAESFGNGVCRDEFELVAVATNRALEDTDALQQAVYDCVTEELEPCTTLRVAAPDRPGLLKDIAASFENLKLSVVGARVAMVQDDDAVTAETRFEVVDRDDAQPIVDPDRLASIENTLARDLDGAAAAGAAVGAPPAPGAPSVDAPSDASAEAEAAGEGAATPETPRRTPVRPTLSVVITPPAVGSRGPSATCRSFASPARRSPAP